jgi:hypothetical protein
MKRGRILLSLDEKLKLKTTTIRIIYNYELIINTTKIAVSS